MNDMSRLRITLVLSRYEAEVLRAALEESLESPYLELEEKRMIGAFIDTVKGAIRRPTAREDRS